jgi:hypothetical protein
LNKNHETDDVQNNPEPVENNKNKESSLNKIATVVKMKGHKNSNGQLAEWVIKDHNTGKILSSHTSREKAVQHMQQMKAFSNSKNLDDFIKLAHEFNN